jgi:hypothetical protein
MTRFLQVLSDLVCVIVLWAAPAWAVAWVCALVCALTFVWLTGCADTVLQDHIKYGVGPRPIECDASLEGC